jgi:ComF family protein
MADSWPVRLVESFLGLFIPAACASCSGPLRGGPEDRLCGQCTGAIERLLEPWCSVCGVPFQDRRSSYGAGACEACRGGRNFRVARAYGAFDGLLRELITRFKYGGERRLAAPLGHLLQVAAQQHLTLQDYDLVVPVPLHRERLRERGFNQGFLLARPLARAGRIPIVHALERTVNTKAQVGLSGPARRVNVRDAFAVVPKRREAVARRTVLLVDDVMTTGATAEDCARALKAAGAKEVDVIVLGRTP